MAVNSAVTQERWSPNFSSGRPAGDPNEIVIHHWGVDGQSHDGVVRYLCREGGDSSAHYVVSGSGVTQLVHDYDRAWHAGSSGNPRGIGIECRPECTPADLEAAARLIAAIRKEWGPLPLTGHKDHMNTACPGRYYARLAELSARADAINKGGSTPVKPSPAPAKPASNKPAKLVVDGKFGADTADALAYINGTPRDRTISSQSAYWKSRFQHVLTTGWEWVNPSDAEGSQLIMATQRYYTRIKVYSGPIDGLVGPDWEKATMRAYKASTLEEAIRNMQRAINKQLGY